MSDLISRSKLLEEIETWGGDVEALHEYIREMPTAYDIDKVVEKFDKNYNNSLWIKGNEEFSITRNELIEIVKQGGVADDVCEWRCDVYGRWHTECHILADNDPLEYAYCPYCGKKIKVVE